MAAEPGLFLYGIYYLYMTYRNMLAMPFRRVRVRCFWRRLGLISGSRKSYMNGHRI